MTDVARADKAIAWLLKTYELPGSAAPRLLALAQGSTEVPISGTAISSVFDACQTHLADSLAVLPLDLIPVGARLIDLGTGLGFPGLALATARPDITVVLVDAVRKKVDAAAGLARSAKLSNVECLWGRAEEIAATDGPHSGQYDCVTARALAKLNVLAEYSAPFLRHGGCMIAWKGGPGQEELDDAEAACIELGLELLPAIALPPQKKALTRSIYVARKTAPTPEHFPRRAGSAVRKPLTSKT